MARVLEDKVKVIIIFGETNRYYRAALRLLSERLPERPICRKEFQKLDSKFPIGSVKDAPRLGRPKITVIFNISLNDNYSTCCI